MNLSILHRKGMARACSLVFAAVLLFSAATFSNAETAADPRENDPGARFRSEYGLLVQSENFPEREGSALLMFTGDIMCLAGQQRAARTENGFDFSPGFRFVRELFALSDLAVGNLETVISSSSPLTADRKTGSDGRPYCNAPEALADALRFAGYDALVTANNHCCDAGEDGIRDTIHVLDERSLLHTGTFEDASVPRYLLFDLNGIRVGMVATTNSVNGHERSISPENRAWMVNLYSEERIREDIALARGAGAEFIVAWMHSGQENSPYVTRIQRDHAAFLAEAGADLIIGAHPHVLQKAEYITCSDGRNVLCAYSLGNFISSMTRSTGNRDTVILCVSLTKSEAGVELSNAGYIGARVLNNAASGAFAVVPVSPALNGGFSEKSLPSARKRIRKAIGNAIPEIDEADVLFPKANPN